MKMMEILRILYSKNEILGAKVISEELKKRGYSLGERAVRYHMHILDERGLTEKVGYKGRKITDEGIEELKKGLIYDQVDFTYSHFQEKMYNVDLDPETGKGSVIVNISSINELDSTALINKMFEKGLSVSNRYHIYEHKNKTYIETVCGTTIDGVLQHNGIISKLMYGGLLKVEDYVPINFTEQIAYSKTSITPLEAFTSSDNTSILDVVTSGTGVIPANFRIIPAVKKEQTIKLLQKLNKININGVITIGEPGKPVLGIPVPEGMTGIAIIGGVTPLCAAQEAGYDLSVKLADSYSEYSKMVSSSHEMKTPLKPATAKNNHQISFILNKISNLISQVNFDEETCEGEVITNISYINREYLDESLEILNKVYKSKPEYCIGNRYSIIDYPDNKVGLGTICSLTVDGINYKFLDPTITTTTSQVLSGKKYYDGSGLKTGTMTNNGELNYTPSTEEQTIPAGYTSGGTISALGIPDNSFADTNAEVYNKIQNQYENMEPRILTDDDKTINKNIYFIPVKKDGTPLLDTSNVTNMYYMFNRCSNLTTIPLLNTSNVTNMKNMFASCTNLTTIPELNTGKVTSTNKMFYNCTNLTTIPLLDTSSVTDMEDMFYTCSSLSDDSLNNIMQMCVNATSYNNTKTLEKIGLTSEQADRCKTLSNYSAFTSAGWTTGY